MPHDAPLDMVQVASDEPTPALEPVQPQRPQLKGAVYISMTGDLPTPAVTQIMNGALSNDRPEARPHFGPFISRDTKINAVTTSPRCARLVKEYLDNGWTVFIEKEEDTIPAIRTLPGIYLLRTRNGMNEVHKVLGTGKTQKVFP